MLCFFSISHIQCFSHYVYIYFCKIISKRLNFEKYVCAMNISFYIKRQFTARKTADKIRNIKTRIYFIYTMESFIYIQSPQFYRRFVFTRIYQSRFNNFIVLMWLDLKQKIYSRWSHDGLNKNSWKHVGTKDHCQTPRYKKVKIKIIVRHTQEKTLEEWKLWKSGNFEGMDALEE